MKARSQTGAESTPRIGMVEWFRPGEYDRVEEVLADLRALGVRDLRVGISWADWHGSEGNGWLAWLLPRLAREVRIVPCLTYTPPSLGVVPKFSSPPLIPKAYADFIDVMITRFGSCLEWIELWNRPDNQHEWDSRLDPDWQIFTEMVGGAAYWIQKRARKVVLPTLTLPNLDWLGLMHERGVLNYVNAVGIQGFPNTAEVVWRGWPQEVGSVVKRLAELRCNAEVWITETGFSTWRGDERSQLHAFVEAASAPVERVYWRCTQDHRPQNIDSYHSDQRDYHYGLKREDGRPKLLFEVWAENGLEGVRKRDTDRVVVRGKKHTLITGGAGFIGTNLASRLLASGKPVLVYDNLSREGTDRNLAWLQETYPKGLRVELADVRDATALRSAVRTADQVFHFAAQVAVTTSLIDPRHDYETNVGGTLTLLEALRSLDTPPPLLFTSTNKVYGGLEHLELEAKGQRYQPLDPVVRTGINETCGLDFHSPYGCSKGAADQYVLDYARTFGLPAVVFRMSCIYGIHQNGTEDQGWVAHFLLRALEGKPLTLFGDGKQVRDLLYIDDLVDAFLLAQSNVETLSGQAFNIGGGLGNTISLLDLLEIIGHLHGKAPSVVFKDWRASDQRYYVSDIQKFTMATGWAPIVNVQRGVRQLYQWLLECRGLGPGRVEPTGAFDAILTH